MGWIAANWVGTQQDFKFLYILVLGSTDAMESLKKYPFGGYNGFIKYQLQLL